MSQQEKKIAGQHRGGVANNTGVDFERSYISWSLCWSLHKAITDSRYLETVIRHQTEDRIDDVKAVLQREVRASQLKTSERLRWTGELVAAFDDQIRINRILDVQAKLELVVASDRLKAELKETAGSAYDLIRFKAH